MLRAIAMYHHAVCCDGHHDGVSAALWLNTTVNPNAAQGNRHRTFLFRFDRVDAIFFGPDMTEAIDDSSLYTNTQPAIQINEGAE